MIFDIGSGTETSGSIQKILIAGVGMKVLWAIKLRMVGGNGFEQPKQGETRERERVHRRWNVKKDPARNDLPYGHVPRRIDCSRWGRSWHAPMEHHRTSTF